MSLLRLSTLGAPEVFHNGSRLTFSLRKAQALLFYLAVEGGMQPRSKLAAFLWPDSEPHDARNALRNALALLRNLLNDDDASPDSHYHLLSAPDLVSLNPHAPMELDLDQVQQAYREAQEISTVPSEEQRAPLIARWQQVLSLVRGPFLDGFWLREETPFDKWVQLQQYQWQVRLQLLFDRLSSWHEASLEHEQASAILTRWLALDPLQEEAYRRLMRLHLARGDPGAAWQVYVTCRERLADELDVKPSSQTVALAERIRAAQAHNPGPSRLSARRTTSTAQSQPPGELTAPLVGRTASINQLVDRFQQAQQGLPQAVLLVGETGIGKTRLASEFMAWARVQGADVLSGHAFEVGVSLPYQPLVEAIQGRLEEENAPEDLLDDLWLAELTRLLPDLRVRYPDLPRPGEDSFTTTIRLFDAVARLFDALAQRAPLVLMLDDLHWADVASLDLLRYLAHYWKKHATPALLLGTVRSEELALNSHLAAQFANLGRDLPLIQVTLQRLSQTETLQFLEAIIGQEETGTNRTEEQRERDLMRPVSSEAGGQSAWKRQQSRLSNFLFDLTEGQPFYLLETLKLLRERQWLIPRLASDGTWRLVPDMEKIPALLEEQPRRNLLPAAVRAMILARMAKLTPLARQLVTASVVVDFRANAQHLWQVAQLDMQAGIQALEEAVRSGMLREENGPGEHMGSYHCANELIREVICSEMGEAHRYMLQQRAGALLHAEEAEIARRQRRDKRLSFVI
ncbi:MAG TPA: AAA family ATPase [Ktedonobacteraceae bacterium]|jgi:DNA-binding SARP family transcriptional activator|nr:AAA family ATPase [Ktedonobacteraceae bacterium]